jgi:RNA polymerase sigma-70 factor (ECF subfamily)
MSLSAARYFPGSLRKTIESSEAELEDDKASPVAATERVLEPLGSSIGTSITTGNLAPLSTTSDEALMAGICNGDVDALSCLFRRYSSVVRAVAYRVLRDVSEADDLLQDVFLWIHRKCNTFDSSKSPARFWILQRTYHCAISRRRYLDSRHFYQQVDLEDVTKGLGERRAGIGRHEDPVDDVFGNGSLKKMFGELSDGQRQTLHLYFFEGYTFEEIAAKLDQTRGNVKHHYFRGLEKLRKQIFGCKPKGK